MTSKTQSPAHTDHRRFVRIPYTVPATYRYAAREDGEAVLCDVGRGGVRLRMGRYLRPGTLVLITVDDDVADSAGPELKASIAWCCPDGSASAFEAGMRVIYDEPSAIAEMSRLVHQGLIASGRMTIGPRRYGETNEVEWRVDPGPAEHMLATGT